ncbi:MAG: hypothetical protein FOGNACKC_03450 [Anaerolineae bacterium]|nr:hypothetical protein [Anaerolineae bacterium]
MLNPRQFLIKLTENLNILQEREARYAGNAPLDLLNQIDDHKTAIALTEQAIAGQLPPEAWWGQLEPLLLPFWQGLSQSVLAVLLETITGQTAISAPAQSLNEITVTHLQQSPKGTMLIEGFTADPTTWEKPVAKELTESFKIDPELTAQVHKLLGQIEIAGVNKPGTTYQATIHGSGSIAQGKGASAATATGSGIAVGGSVKGAINLERRSKDDE